MTETNGTAAFDVATVRAQLQAIAHDMAQDARNFEGAPFEGPIVAEYMGNHGAAIARLAKILLDLLAVAQPVKESRLDELEKRLTVAEAFARSGCPCEVAS